MKTKKLLTTLFILPLLAGCGKQPEPKGDLVIPTVDVDAITPTLPEKPGYTGNILSDGTYDYIDFYQLSDMHGAVNSDSDKIGLAKLCSYLNIKRKQNPGGTVVVSSGDMFQGSAESNLTRGYMVNYSMNYMGFDSMAIGNHEFDWTDTWLKKNANLEYNGHKMSFISANIVKKGTNVKPDFLSKSVVVQRGEYKIGIIGSIGEKLKSSILASCVENYEFINQIDAVKAESTRLKEEEHCNVVILTAHDDIDNLSTLTKDYVDGVFGGHTHSDKASYIDGVIPAVQTENYGKSISHIQLKIEKETKAVSCSVRELDDKPLTLQGLSEDANVKAIMNNYNSEINKIKELKLGKTEQTLVKDKALKGICVEAMYQGALKGINSLGLQIDPADILATFHNVNGGIRDDIKAGEITYGDVYNPFPFDNEVVLYKLTGSKFLSKTSKLTGLAARRTFEKRDEIDPKKDYYIVITDFLATSSAYLLDAFNISEQDLIRTGKVVRDEVADLIYQKDIIDGSIYTNVAPYKDIPLGF